MLDPKEIGQRAA